MASSTSPQHRSQRPCLQPVERQDYMGSERCSSYSFLPGPWNYLLLRVFLSSTNPFKNPHHSTKGGLRSYRAFLLLLQIGYIYFLYSNNEDVVNAAANVGSHFIVNNVLTSAWLLLWVYGWFWIGEIPLVLNLINLTSLYFCRLRAPRFVHYPVVSGPLAFTFVAILWNGAAMVNAHTFAARIVANIAIWAILLYGLFFLIAFKDYGIGWEMSILSLGS